jgi:hypothetical protein
MNAAPLAASVAGIGFVAPGLPDWPAAAAVLRGDAPYAPAPSVLPAPALLPPAERRRASRIVRLALAVGLEAVSAAGADAAKLATVFSASGGDGHNCHALCEALASDDRQISPTRFHNSVHNTAAGYWGIATGSREPCQVLCAHDASFAAGLLEALATVVVQRTAVLLVAYDAEYPEPIHTVRSIPDAGGVALLLTPAAGAGGLARIAARLDEAPADESGVPELERLRQSIPALRALPLLEAIARGRRAGVALEYLAPLALRVAVEPC